MSKKLAIQGHSTRGKEVIELLKVMGGTNPFSNNGELLGNKENCCYYITYNLTPCKYISWNYIGPEEIDKYAIFTLEEFLKKYPFKVGDKVVDGYGDSITIKSMEWSEDCETMVYDFKDSVIVLAAEDLLKYNPVETISHTVSLKDDKAIGNSIDSVQFIQSGKIVAVRFNTQNYENEVELQLDDYEIEIRNGKTYAVRKKPKYPTTYEECFNEHTTQNTLSLLANKTDALYNLLICCRAYWKIAGEQMGLGKPWEPNWKDTKSVKYAISMHDGIITKMYLRNENVILAFPTEEMRDAFYENFKELIEQCKELL